MRVAKTFEALGHPTRLELVRLLAGWAWSPSELARRFGCSWTTIGKHLEVLREARLVDRFDAEYGPGYAWITNRERCREVGLWLQEFEDLEHP